MISLVEVNYIHVGSHFLSRIILLCTCMYMHMCTCVLFLCLDINESDLKMPLTDEEGEIRSHLLNGDLLSEETILKYLEPFWFDEPYK